MKTKKATKKPAPKKLTKAAIKKAQLAREAKNTALAEAANKRMPLVQDPEPPRVKRQRRPPPPNPTVLALQSQIVPLVDFREQAIQAISQYEQQAANIHTQLEYARKQLQTTEGAISYRLQLIAQIEGRELPLILRQEHAPIDLSGVVADLPENTPIFSGSPTSFSGISSIPSGRAPQLGAQHVPDQGGVRSESAEEERRAM